MIGREKIIPSWLTSLSFYFTLIVGCIVMRFSSYLKRLEKSRPRIVELTSDGLATPWWAE